MIKLIDILFENESSDIFVPRRLVDRRVRLNKLTQQEVDRMVGEYNRNPTKFHPVNFIIVTMLNLIIPT